MLSHRHALQNGNLVFVLFFSINKFMLIIFSMADSKSSGIAGLKKKQLKYFHENLIDKKVKAQEIIRNKKYNKRWIKTRF